MAVRTIPVVGKHHFTGEIVADFRGPRIIRFESHLEMQVIEVLRARSDVSNIEEQLQAVTWTDGSGKIREHFFDLRVTLDTGERIAVAVKPAAKVRSSGIRLVLADLAGRLDPAFAHRAVLITDQDLDPVDIRNATLLNRLNRLSPEATDRARDVISGLGASCRIRDIAIAIGMGPAGSRAVLGLLRSGELRLVRKEAITPDTVVEPTRRAA